MNPIRRNVALGMLFFSLRAIAGAAGLPDDWQHEQTFEVTNAGLVKLSLPRESIGVARADLGDLRVYDEAGNEVPYLVQHPSPAPRMPWTPKLFRVTQNPQNTVITIETGTTDPIDLLMLAMQVTPANANRTYAKFVEVESSTDGRRWGMLLRRDFYLNPAAQLRINFDSLEIRPWLRVTLADSRSEQIPFTGAFLMTAPTEVAREEVVPVAITDRQEAPGKTRLSLRLPEANLDISRLVIVSPQQGGTRSVTFTVEDIEGDSVSERPIGSRTIFSSVTEDDFSTNLYVSLSSQVRSRELFMSIDNEDGPPLVINGARARRMPVYLVFSAKHAGTYHLLTGNAAVTSPPYDLADLRPQSRSVAVSLLDFSPLKSNASYHAREGLPEPQENGAVLDVAAWGFRKPIKITGDGVQKLVLDPEVLSRSRLGVEDLRVVRDGKQVPYIREHTLDSRAITPVVIATNSSENPRLSRWILKLPRPHLPVNRLLCEHRGFVFQRNMVLYEELSNEHGEKYRRILSQSTWIQLPDRKGREYALSFDSPPQTDTLYLETDNGDNLPLELENFRMFYPVTQLLFKAKEGEPLMLYYGNAEAEAPHYDLSLAATELLAANKTTASLGVEEVLKKPWTWFGTDGKGGAVFWGILALVVVALLLVIARLLPKSDAQPPK